MTSLIEILELPKCGHMTSSTISFESRDNILLVTSWTEIMRSQRLFQNTFILRRSRVSLLKEPLKNKNYTKMQSMSVFLDIKKLIISAEKC